MAIFGRSQQEVQTCAPGSGWRKPIDHLILLNQGMAVVEKFDKNGNAMLWPHLHWSGGVHRHLPPVSEVLPQFDAREPGVISENRVFFISPYIRDLSFS